MNIIEIIPLENGGHRNQTVNGNINVPEGWAVIPEDMAIPSTFPFVHLTVDNQVVVAMSEGTMPEVEPEQEQEPSQLDIIEAQVTYTALMTDTLIMGE